MIACTGFSVLDSRDMLMRRQHRCPLKLAALKFLGFGMLTTFVTGFALFSTTVAYRFFFPSLSNHTFIFLDNFLRMHIPNTPKFHVSLAITGLLMTNFFIGPLLLRILQRAILLATTKKLRASSQ